jgi:hypothetical protein
MDNEGVLRDIEKQLIIRNKLLEEIIKRLDVMCKQGELGYGSN